MFETESSRFLWTSTTWMSVKFLSDRLTYVGNPNPFIYCSIRVNWNQLLWHLSADCYLDYFLSKAFICHLWFHKMPLYLSSYFKTTNFGISARIRRSKFIKGSREIAEGDTSSGNTIYLSHVLGANIRRLQKTGQLENQGTCIGFGVYVYKVKESGVKFVEEVVLFNHPSEQISKKWCLSIQQYIGRNKC